jgi:hypothetical protein
MSSRVIHDLEVLDSQWEPTGPEEDLTARLLSTVCVNGIHHHLEAYAVKEKDGIQVVVNDSFESNYEGMCQASEPDGRYQVVEILGREYVLLMTPHC